MDILVENDGQTVLSDDCTLLYEYGNNLNVEFFNALSGCALMLRYPLARSHVFRWRLTLPQHKLSEDDPMNESNHILPIWQGTVCRRLTAGNP